MTIAHHMHKLYLLYFHALFNFLDCYDEQLPIVVVQYSFLDGEALPIKLEAHH